ncbi:hypothetical protein AAES_53923 [Amazona aestiva]|uniref:Uncharacterized protein n=1 Tax=Amazona aestiva TaxID=12930 RepID=A0A0Q3REF9_AMAAE|nr:hypothetical protein AAES_53923 [Amazona aestiva]
MCRVHAHRYRQPPEAEGSALLMDKQPGSERMKHVWIGLVTFTGEDLEENLDSGFIIWRPGDKMDPYVISGA